jgi:hypothetical protein
MPERGEIGAHLWGRRESRRQMLAQKPSGELRVPQYLLEEGIV